MTLKASSIIVGLLTTLALTPAVRSQDSADDTDLRQFLELLDQQTTLATNSRLNADFVPGMVSVVDGSELRRRGFRSVWQALESLPGVIATQNETGLRSVGVRGLGDLFESGKVKLLLNGVALNPSASGTTGPLLDTPIEQVERIEFIRGPGSAVHGEFAYAGVLNVITRSRGEAYGAELDTGNGTRFSLLREFGGGGFRGSINLAAGTADGDDIDSGPDRTPSGTPSYAPGPINNKRDFFSAIVELEFGDIDALLQLQQGNRGDHFGTNNLLPPDDRQTVISETQFSAVLRRAFEIAPGYDAEWSLHALAHDTEQNELFLGLSENFGGLGNEDDIVADTRLSEQRIEARLNLAYARGAHRLFAELVATDIRVTESEQFINLVTTIGPPSPTMNEFPGPVADDADRRALSLVLQDEYRIDEMTTLTAGLRYDDYEDIGDNLSPRLALVWRASDRQVFKTQLARAFRPPSLIETGGARDQSVEPETNDTIEFGYIYVLPDGVIRNTLYHSRLDDLIMFQDFAPFGYYNAGSQELTGYEIELERSLGTNWQVHSSLSLQDYADEGLPGAAPWLLKLGLGYTIAPLTEAHLQVNAIGSRDRAAGDSRDDFDQTTRLDLTLKRRNLAGIAGLDLHLGIDNLLDERLEQPSPADTYPGDYPYSDGALLWLQLVYQP